VVVCIYIQLNPLGQIAIIITYRHTGSIIRVYNRTSVVSPILCQGILVNIIDFIKSRKTRNGGRSSSCSVSDFPGIPCHLVKLNYIKHMTIHRK
jgi:hypothetical protein